LRSRPALPDLGQPIGLAFYLGRLLLEDKAPGPREAQRRTEPPPGKNDSIGLVIVFVPTLASIAYDAL